VVGDSYCGLGRSGVQEGQIIPLNFAVCSNGVSLSSTANGAKIMHLYAIWLGDNSYLVKEDEEGHRFIPLFGIEDEALEVAEQHQGEIRRVVLTCGQ
jgi:hypothetical protein